MFRRKSRPNPIKYSFNQGDTWYLVDFSWKKKLNNITNYDPFDQVSTFHPGPVRTSSLLADTSSSRLKQNLKEGIDYCLIPETEWKTLVESYGLATDSRPIPRKVVEYSHLKRCEVEVYLLKLKLAVHPKLTEYVIEEFSRGDTVADLEAVLRRIHVIPAETLCRVWHKDKNELLSDPSQTLSKAGIFSDMETIVIEKQLSDGSWPRSIRSPYQFPEGNTTPNCNENGTVKHPATTKEGGLKQPQGEPADDWFDEIVQSVATEQKRANQATQQAQDALSQLAQRESQVLSLNKTLDETVSHLQDLERSLGEEQKKRLEAEARASNVEQSMAQLHTETLQDVTQRLCRAEEDLKQRDIQIQELTESQQTVQEELNVAMQRYGTARSRIRSLGNELRGVQQQLQETTEGLQECEQRLLQAYERAHQLQEQATTAETLLQQANQRADEQHERAAIAETHLQQAYERADEQQKRAVAAEMRLQHSDQVFHDLFQRLIGQVPQSQPYWVVQRNEIELSDDELGRGAWATVKVAMFRGNRVAAKCLHRQIVSAHNVRLFTREMNMAANARHPNLLQFIGATLDDQEPIIMTELMPTSLRHVMESGTWLTHPQVISVSHQVALALNYLHLTQPSAIIHRDVSSSNVLLESHQSSWKAKLSDYGSANFVRHTTTAGPGNPTYAAPEASNPERQSAKMDVFSFGVLLVEMCSGELAPPEHRDRLIADIQWPAMVALVQQCLRHEPQRRPDMTTVIALLDQI